MPKFMVEWNLPKDLTKDKYMAKKVKSLDIYPKIPECKWESTFLADDMSKCYCVYDAPDEETVRKAREMVQARVDLLATVDEITPDSLEEERDAESASAE